MTMVYVYTNKERKQSAVRRGVIEHNGGLNDFKKLKKKRYFITKMLTYLDSMIQIMIQTINDFQVFIIRLLSLLEPLLKIPCQA